MWLLALTLSGLAQAADCPQPVSLAALQARAADTEQAILAGELQVSTAQIAALDAALPCLDGPVTPAFAAQVHRLHGIDRVLAGDELGALGPFMAARVIEPDAPLLAQGAPSSGPIAEAYASIDPTTARTAPLPEPADGALLLDGRATRERGVDRPVLLQLLPSDGPLFTAYLDAGAPPPDYPVAGTPPVATVAPAPEEPAGADLAAAPAPEQRGPQPALFWSGLASGLTAGGLYIGSHVALSDFNRLPQGTAVADAEAAQGKVNGLSIASAVTASVSIGLLGSSLVVGR